jgi:hypothetical protein
MHGQGKCKKDEQRNYTENITMVPLGIFNMVLSFLAAKTNNIT